MEIENNINRDLDTLPENLKWFVLGALKVLLQVKDIKEHHSIRRYMFEQAKLYGDDTKKAFLTINKLDIDHLGM